MKASIIKFIDWNRSNFNYFKIKCQKLDYITVKASMNYLKLKSGEIIRILCWKSTKLKTFKLKVFDNKLLITI